MRRMSETTSENSYPEMGRGEGIACADKVKETNNHRSRGRTRAISFTKYGIKRKRKLLLKKKGTGRELLENVMLCQNFVLVDRFLGKKWMKIRMVDSERCNPVDPEPHN